MRLSLKIDAIYNRRLIVIVQIALNGVDLRCVDSNGSMSTRFADIYDEVLHILPQIFQRLVDLCKILRVEDLPETFMMRTQVAPEASVMTRVDKRRAVYEYDIAVRNEFWVILFERSQELLAGFRVAFEVR